jgi:hypothetical protein
VFFVFPPPEYGIWDAVDTPANTPVKGVNRIFSAILQAHIFDNPLLALSAKRVCISLHGFPQKHLLHIPSHMTLKELLYHSWVTVSTSGELQPSTLRLCSSSGVVITDLRLLKNEELYILKTDFVSDFLKQGECHSHARSRDVTFELDGQRVQLALEPTISFNALSSASLRTCCKS